MKKGRGVNRRPFEIPRWYRVQLKQANDYGTQKREHDPCRNQT